MSKAIVLGAVCALFLSGWTHSPKPSQAAVAPTVVKIQGMAFSPATITVAKGTRVTWKNLDSVSHTSTSNTGVWNSGTLGPGKSYGRRFAKKGTFPYHCAIHPSMTGTVVVN